MRQVIVGRYQGIVDWLKDRLNAQVEGLYTTIGVLDENGALLGGGMLHNWTRYDMELTYYGQDTMSRRVFQKIAEAGEEANCHRMTIRVPRGHRKTLVSLPRLGFKYEGTQRRFYGPRKADDAIAFGILASEWTRFLPKAELRKAA